MQHDEKQLHELALDIPWWMFTGEEIAVLCRVSQNVVSKVKTMSDSPFFLNKCRPEWFLEWMRTHPAFELTKGGPTPDPEQRDGSAQHVLAVATPSPTPKPIRTIRSKSFATKPQKRASLRLNRKRSLKKINVT